MQVSQEHRQRKVSAKTQLQREIESNHNFSLANVSDYGDSKKPRKDSTNVAEYQMATIDSGRSLFLAISSLKNLCFCRKVREKFR